ncbi:MAG: tRNA epoxyqueuosine(34) reductase QueG [Phycisphaerales bacterium]
MSAPRGGGGSAASPSGKGPLHATQHVLQRCREFGFAAAGVCSVQPSQHAAAFRSWLEQGRHGTMEYMAEDVPQRLDPALLVPGARAAICVADRYAHGRPDARQPGRGRIARYARGEDYHAVIRARLEALADELRRMHPEHRFRVCVDTAPVLERELAERAGLGRVGKHTLLIGHQGQGSWLLLGVILTTLELHAQDHPHQDPCAQCTRCVDACPTQAIQPWTVDGSRCISYLTIEHQGAVEPALAQRTGDWIFGCDICQEVCPHNQPTRRSKQAAVHPAYQAHHTGFDLLEVLGWTAADWEAAQLNGVLRRATQPMWVRNAAMAAGHALRQDGPLALQPDEAAALRSRLSALARDGSQPPAVQLAAQRALE